MKKVLAVLLAVLLTASLSACTSSSPSPSGSQVGLVSPSPDIVESLSKPIQGYAPDEETVGYLTKELESSFKYFWETANSDESSKGYGLIPDRLSAETTASIAAVGYSLVALCVGAQRGYVTYEEAEQRAKGTLATLRDYAESSHGFFYQYLNISDGTRAQNSTLSSVDTAICINGVLAAGMFFGGDCDIIAQSIYNSVEWSWFVNSETKQFYKENDPVNGFSGAWDMASGQYMLYFLGAGSTTFPTDGELFYNFTRNTERYGSTPPVIYSPSGSLHTYQLSHMWYDLRGSLDKNDVDWFQNSVNAALSARQYAIDNAALYNTSALDWGFAQSYGTTGVVGNYGAPPSKEFSNDGTVSTYGVIASLPFTPKYSCEAIIAQYSLDALVGEYGLKEAYKRTGDGRIVSEEYVGIHKGASLIMIENYLSGFIWDIMRQIPQLSDGLGKCNIRQGADVENLKNVIITGGSKVGDTLEIFWDTYPRYDLFVNAVEWLVCDNPEGANATVIDGSGSLTYTITEQDVDRYLFCRITGVQIENNVLTALTPVSSNISAKIPNK